MSVDDRARLHSEFLIRAGAALADSLDLEVTLNTVARLACPGIADSCAIHLIDEAGQVRLVAANHVDPAKADAMRTLADPASASPSRIWLRTILDGTPSMLADIQEDDVRRAYEGCEHLLKAFREVAFTSQISVPLRARGRTIGGLTFMLGPGTRRFDDADMRLAEALAQRAALAVDNARAYREAREANRLKDEFLATLSHELRTPLNAILGYARMLRGGLLTDAQKQARGLEIIARNAEVLTQIVEDVLDVSRIVAGKLHLNMQPTDFAAVVDDAVATVGPMAEAKHVMMRTDIDRQLPLVLGDPERLQQVVWNLLSNAVKFTAGGGLVHLSLSRDRDGALLTVADTGCGIEPEFLPHLFERFRQADSRFARTHGGLGLGLAIAREIVHVHGGTIRAESDGPGRGSVFTLKFPFIGSPTAVHPLPSTPRSIVTAERTLAGTRILVVDDDEDGRGLVQAILEEAGAVVTPASSGPAALEQLATMRPDVIVSDIGMPGMDGLQLMSRIRLLGGDLADVPALALTAYARSEDRQTALAAGYQRHLPKPVDPVQLVAAISAVLVAPTSS